MNVRGKVCDFNEKSNENKKESNENKQEQISIILSIIEQNLLHARHAEMQRLMFNSLYMTIVGVGLAFIFDKAYNEFVSIGFILFLMLLGVITILLTIRWNDVFSIHWEEAEKGYKNLRKKYFDSLCDITQFHFKIDLGPDKKITKRAFITFQIFSLVLLGGCLVYFIYKVKV